MFVLHGGSAIYRVDEQQDNIVLRESFRGIEPDYYAPS